MVNLRMNSNKDLKKFFKKYKLYLVGIICFFMGIIFPRGVDKEKYNEALNNISNLELQLEESKNLEKNLQTQVDDAEEFLNLDENYKSLVIKNIEEIKSKEIELQKIEEEKKEKEAKVIEKRVTNIFKNIYLNFAYSVGSSAYEEVVGSIEKSGYKYTIQKPTTDDLGIIKVYDKSSDDVVTLIFYPENNIEILTVLQYDRGKNSVSISDDLHIKSPEYSIYNGTNTQVYTVNEQKEFIFTE